jgi:thiamine pyrophosphokinase
MQEPTQPPAERPILEFTRPLAIVGGGAVDMALLRELATAGVHLVGADGGGDVIAAAGLVPEAIIGDLDSITDAGSWGPATRVIRIAEQITTDFEKCLYSTKAPLTIALGMTGRRFDHTLSAISAVTAYARQRRIVLVDESGIALALSGRFAFAAKPGERVSVYPLLPIDFTSSRGLFYPLDGLHLEQGGLIGTSNAADAEEVEIVPADDTPWLLILEKAHLALLIVGHMG